jgi:hypothetical protein
MAVVVRRIGIVKVMNRVYYSGDRTFLPREREVGRQLELASDDAMSRWHDTRK